MDKPATQRGRKSLLLEPLESRVMLAAPDLFVQIAALPPEIPTAYTLKTHISETNETAQAISGQETVDVQFSQDAGATWTTLASKFLTASIAPGATMNLAIPVTIPADAIPSSANDVLQVVVTPPNGVTADTPQATANVVWEFGNVPGLGSNVPCTAVDPYTGNTATFTLSGPGLGTLSDSGNNNGGGDLWDLMLTDTAWNSKASVSVAGSGDIALESVWADSPLGAFYAPAVDLQSATGLESYSFMSFDGGLRSLTMHDTSAQDDVAHEVSIGYGPVPTFPVSITFHDANDLALDSAAPITMFQANGLVAHNDTSDSYSPTVCSDEYIGRVLIANDFAGINTGSGTARPEISLGCGAGVNPANHLAIGEVQIGGDMDSAVLYALGSLGNIRIAGTVDGNSAIQSDRGNIVNVQIGGDLNDNSYVFAPNGLVRNVQVGGTVDNSSSVQTVDGNIGNVTIGGDLDDGSYIYASNGRVGTVQVGGNVDNGSGIDGSQGGVAAVKIGGNLDGDSYVYSANGQLGNIQVGGTVDNASYISTTRGKIASVKIAGNLDHKSYVYSGYADLGRVQVGGNADNGAEIFAEHGNIGSVQIGGNLDNGSEAFAHFGNLGSAIVGGYLDNGSVIESSEGNTAFVKIGGYLDHTSYVYAWHGSLGDVQVGGYLDNHSSIESDRGNIASVKIAGTVDNTSFIQVLDVGNIGSVIIGGSLDHSSFVFAQDGSLGYAEVGGNLDNGSRIWVQNKWIGTVKIGGYLDHGSFVYGWYASLGNVQVGGYLDNSSSVDTEHGNIASVKIGGKVDNSSFVQAKNFGSIGSVVIGGYLDHGAHIYTDQGNISNVNIAGKMDNAAYVETAHLGNIGAVEVGGNVDNGSLIEAASNGNVGAVVIGGNLDNGAQVYADYGNIKSVLVKGNLDNSAEIYNVEGSIGPVTIRGNLDHAAEVYSQNGVPGIQSVRVQGNFDNGAKIYAGQGGIGFVTVLGNALGDASDKPNVFAYGRIGAIKIAEDAVYVDFETYAAIGTVAVGGLLQNGLIAADYGGPIGSVTCGQLDSTTVETGQAYFPPAGDSGDFIVESHLGSVLIRGVKSGGVTNYMTGTSEILAWRISRITFAGPSAGSGTIEYTVGLVVNAPTGVTVTQVA